MKRLWAILKLLGIPLLIYGVYYWNWYSQDQIVYVNDQLRGYRIHRPINKTKAKAAIFMLHGYGDHPRIMELYSGMSRLADKEGFLVVYPYGSKSEVDESLSWNADFCCGTALFNRVDDSGFLNILANKIAAEEKIERSNMYLAGFSNGALLTAKIASEHNDLFSGYGIMSGSTGGQGMGSDGYVNFVPRAEQTKVITIHGKDDPAVPYFGGMGKYKKTIPAPLELNSFFQSKQFWMDLNDCRNSQTFNGQNYEIETGENCKPGGKFKAITVYNRGHIWLGDIMEIVTYGNLSGINTSKEFWKFFYER